MSRPRADRVLALTSTAAAGVVVGLFAWLLADVVRHGVGLLSWRFLTASPVDAGRAGGIAPILVATSWILAVCLAVALPIGLGTALLLAELTPSGGRLGGWIRLSLDVLAGVPSIVFGLFGTVFFCQLLGLGFSILAGGLTLACMILPIVIRATEVGLRAVPDELRLGAAALGLSRTTTLVRLVIPAAAPGLVVGVVLGIGRASAETAALLFTSGYVARMPESLTDGGRALSIHVYDLALNVPGGTAAAHASALVLVGALLAINSLAAWVRARWLGR